MESHSTDPDQGPISSFLVHQMTPERQETASFMSILTSLTSLLYSRLAYVTTDKSPNGCFKLAERDRAGFVVKDGLLYHRAKILGQSFLQLVVPSSHREHVSKMGHEAYGGHMSVKRTKARISYTFYWPSLAKDCCRYIQTCASAS